MFDRMEKNIEKRVNYFEKKNPTEIGFIWNQINLPVKELLSEFLLNY